MTESFGLGYPHEVPKPGEQQCEADGVRNGPDGPGGTDHYWTCTAPGTVDVDGTLYCEDHLIPKTPAGRDDTHDTRDNPRAAGTASDRGAQPPGLRAVFTAWECICTEDPRQHFWGQGCSAPGCDCEAGWVIGRRH